MHSFTTFLRSSEKYPHQLKLEMFWQWIIYCSLLPIDYGKNKKGLLFIELIITKLLGKENDLFLYFWYAATQASLSHDSAFNN